MTKQIIIDRIKAVFPVTGVPKPEHIVQGSSGEDIEIKAMLAGKQWTALKNEELAYENSALSSLTDEAFCYYLPAYMMLLLTDLDTADVLGTRLILHLRLPLEVDTLSLMHYLRESRDTNEHIDQFLVEQLKNSSVRAGAFIRRMKGFTPEQGKVINQFLHFLAREHPDYYDENETLIASERYWFQFGL